MDFQYGPNGLTEEQRHLSTQWLGPKLEELFGESDEAFLEYIVIMLGNQKSMEEIAKELVAFLGEEGARTFASDLGTFLKKSSGSSGRLLQKAIKSSQDSTVAKPSEASADSKSTGEKHVSTSEMDRDAGATLHSKKTVPLGALKSTRSETPKEVGGLSTSRDRPAKRRPNLETRETRVVKLSKGALACAKCLLMWL